MYKKCTCVCTFNILIIFFQRLLNLQFIIQDNHRRLIRSMLSETRFRIESRTKCIDLQHDVADVEREIEIQLRTRGAILWPSSLFVFHLANLSCLPSSLFFRSLPSPGGVFARHDLLYARRITRRIVCDNDNQRVKRGFNFLWARGREKKREIETRMVGRGKKEENACIHLPRNTQACTQHRRTLCGQKGARREEREERSE